MKPILLPYDMLGLEHYHSVLPEDIIKTYAEEPGALLEFIELAINSIDLNVELYRVLLKALMKRTDQKIQNYDTNRKTTELL